MKKLLLPLIFLTSVAQAAPAPFVFGSDGKSINLQTGIALPQASTPSAPVTGRDYLYIKSDDQLYLMGHNGVEQQIPNAGTVFYQTIQGNSTPATQRTTENFSTNFAVTDASSITQIDLAATISAATSGNAATCTKIASNGSNTQVWAMTGASTQGWVAAGGSGNLTGPITSVGLATSVAAQTGTGSTFVMDTSPTLVTPALGTPSALVGTNISGTAANLTAGHVTTDANLTGPITSSGNATSIAAQTGTGSTFVVQTSPTLTTPVLGVATGTEIALTLGTASHIGLTLTGASSQTGDLIDFQSSTPTKLSYFDANGSLMLPSANSKDSNGGQLCFTAQSADSNVCAWNTRLSSVNYFILQDAAVAFFEEDTTHGNLQLGSQMSGAVPFYITLESNNNVATPALAGANMVVNYERNSTAGMSATYGFAGSSKNMTSYIAAYNDTQTASSEVTHLGLGTTAAGTLAEKLRIMSKGQMAFGGTAPTAGACGTSPVAPVGNDNMFRITSGTGGIATTCVVNFAATWANAPSCHCTDETTLATFEAEAVATTTAVTISTFTRATGIAGAFTASDVFSCDCRGYF